MHARIGPAKIKNKQVGDLKLSSWGTRLVSALIVFSSFFAFSHAFADEAITDSGMKVVTGFSDVPRSHPHYTAVTYLSQAGVLNGYGDGTFGPDNSINRAEVLKVILAGSGIEIDEDQDATGFGDVPQDAWFAKYVKKAKRLSVITGNADGSFAPGRQVNKAELLKMLLLANRIDPNAIEAVEGDYADVSQEAWFRPYMYYAAQLGLVAPDHENKLNPSKAMTRSEVADVLYILALIRNGQNTQFLLDRAEAEMAQIEVYVAANKILLSKKASELAVDLTQQAYKNMPTNNVVLGAAKLARAYDWLVDSFILGIQRKYDEAEAKANDAINKATEAWEANNATQPIAKHIKERAREILGQVGGTEQ